MPQLTSERERPIDLTSNMLLDEKEILATFHDLVASKIILYGPEEIVRLTDKSFSFEFRVCPTLLSKPSRPGKSMNLQNGEEEEDDEEVVQTFGPGSDLVKADPRLIVAEVFETHILVLNRFCVFAPQYLLLTVDSYKKQVEPLDESDLAAAWASLLSLNTEHYVIFNCGEAAGCSRSHKHMQVLPIPEGFTLFPDNSSLHPKSIPFKFFIKYLECQDTKVETQPRALAVAYTDLLQRSDEVAQSWTGTNEEHCPHNMILTKRWIMVLPRRETGATKATANAAGMLGMVWVTRKEHIEQWREHGPANILAHLGFPS